MGGFCNEGLGGAEIGHSCGSQAEYSEDGESEEAVQGVLFPADPRECS